MNKYPNLQIVTSTMAVQMLSQFFFNADFAGRIITIKEGDTLSLGKHTLQFIMAPMVTIRSAMKPTDAETINELVKEMSK